MKLRLSKRVVWLVIPLVPVAVLSLMVWLGGDSAAVDMATRGAKPPPPRQVSLLSPGSWPAGDWLDEGMESFMDWEHNPWRRHNHGFSVELGERLRELEASDRPEDREEAARLRKLGREWFERMRERFPELAVTEDKTIPREENGFLQWSELVRRVTGKTKDSIFDTPMSQEMLDNIRKRTPQDPESVKEWVKANRERIDEIRAIGLLPGQSAQGVSDENRTPRFLRSASQALMMDAQDAVASGDVDRAMESIRAANGLLDHHSKIAFPTLYETLATASMRSQLQNHVLTTLMPSLPSGQMDVAAWQTLLHPTLQQPSEFTRTLRGEWNVNMPHEVLPALSDTKDPSTPSDADYLVESYSRHMREMTGQAEGLTLAEYAASPRVNVEIDDLSRKSREAGTSLGMSNGWNAQSAFVTGQERIGLTQAAFAIMNGQAVPLDPVYGLPYKWNPV